MGIVREPPSCGVATQVGRRRPTCATPRNNPVNAVDPSGLEEVSQRWWPHRRTRLEEGTEIVPVPIPADATNPETSRPAPATNPQDFSLYPDLNELEKTSDFYGRHAPTAQPIPADFAPDHPADAPIHIDTTGENPHFGGLSVPGLAPEDVPRYLELVVEGYNLRKEMKAIELHLWDIPPAQTSSRIKEIASLQDRLYNLNKEYRRVHLTFEKSGFGNLTTTGESPGGHDEGTQQRTGRSLAGAIDAYELARSRPGPGGLEDSWGPGDFLPYGAAGLRIAVRRVAARPSTAKVATQGAATTAPVAGPKDISLGIRRQHGGMLEEFSERIGAPEMSRFKELGLYDEGVNGWGRAFMQIMNRTKAAGGRAHFDLTGVDIARAKAGNPASWQDSYTAFEFRSILRRRDWFEITDFYRHGTKVTPQEMIDLGIVPHNFTP